MLDERNTNMIRLATLDDIDKIINIYKQIVVKTMVNDVKYRKFDFIKNIKNNNIYVYDNPVVVGFILFYDHATWAYVEILCVDEKYRNMSIGKKLLEHINKKWDIVELCCHIEDINTIKFIEKCNFISSNQVTSWFYRKKK